MSKAIQSFTTSEAVAFFWAMLALRRLVIVGPNRKTPVYPDASEIGHINVEWLTTAAFEPERVSSRTAILTIPLRTEHVVEIQVTVGAVSNDWLPRKIEWWTINGHKGSFSFLDTAEIIMVCDRCCHEFSPMVPERDNSTYYPTQSQCRFCPVEHEPDFLLEAVAAVRSPERQ